MSLLRASDIKKNFGGVKALKGISFDAAAGEVHGLVGENGAGKSTLIKILTGALQPDSGELWFDGRQLKHTDPFHARQQGIAAIYQQPALFPHLTVAENIAIGGDSGRPWRKISWPARRKQAEQVLQRIGARISPDAVISDLSPAEQQLVELAKAIKAEARVLIMDEPTASLGEQETQNLYRLVDEMKANGVAVIYISHRFEELIRLADRVTILRDGNSLGTYPMHSVTQGDLIRLMVGREITTIFPPSCRVAGEIALDVRGLRCPRTGIQDVSLTVRRGEIVGLAGLVGSGRTQFAECLFGLTPAEDGQVYVDGFLVKIAAPSNALALGIAYVPEDRRRHGVVMEMPIDQNISLPSLQRVAHHSFIERKREESVASDFSKDLAIKASSVRTIVRNLSGGNQQKVALARWLFTEPKILILDEPTQGVDVGAKAEIYRLIADFAAAGLAILLISSEMPEVIGLSDRIAVMRRGRIAGVLTREEATPHTVLELALGHSLPLKGAQ